MQSHLCQTLFTDQKSNYSSGLLSQGKISNIAQSWAVSQGYLMLTSGLPKVDNIRWPDLGEWSKTCCYCKGWDPWVHAVISGNTYCDICMIIHASTSEPIPASYTVRRTTRAYNGTIATKGLFIMCPSANVIGIKDKLIIWANDSGLPFRI